MKHPYARTTVTLWSGSWLRSALRPARVLLLLLAWLAAMPQLAAAANAYVGTSYCWQSSPAKCGQVEILDTWTNTVRATVNVDNSPVGIAASPDGAFAYAALFTADKVAKINTATYAVSYFSLPSGANPYRVAVSRDGAYLWVSNPGNKTISVIPTAGGSIYTLSFSDTPDYVAFTPDGSYAYVTVDGPTSHASVKIYNTGAAPTLAYTVTLPGIYARGVAITPNGQYAYAASYDPYLSVYGFVTVINASGTPSWNKDITVGRLPVGVAVTPDGTQAWVVNTNDQNIAVIDTTTNNKTGTTIGSDHGEEVAFSTDGTTAYSAQVTSTSCTVRAINTATYAISNVVVNSYGCFALAAGVGVNKVSVAYVSPTGNIAGDFNGDGQPDFAVISSTQVVTSFGDGAGNVTSHTYTFPHSWSFGNPVTNGNTVVVGDFNNDGKTDFILVESTKVYSFLSNGDGTYSQPSASPYYYTFPNSWAFGTPVTSSYTPIVGDFDGDGKSDFALLGSTAVFTFKSSGDGTFTTLKTTSPYYYTFPNSWAFGAPPGSTYAPIVGDLNADGKTDFAFLSGNAVFSFRNNGDGTFPPLYTTSPNYYTLPNSWNFGTPVSSSYTPVVGDLDGDGKTDFAVLGSTQIFTFRNNGDGTFPAMYTTSPNYTTVTSGWGFGTPPSSGFAPFVGYLDRDGKADYALMQSTQVFTFKSNGNGTYTSPSYYTLPNGWGLGSPPTASYSAVSFGGGPTMIFVNSTDAFTLTSSADGTYVVRHYSL
ncbi:FG-GAP-like repeat-containing protein [Paludibaculum fermentans]|uniref:FG-GAP-like repeat-containing protein n=1 Tax=Paludibaculum fermentans TaxID=1473598 RepID=UPI003EB8C375